MSTIDTYTKALLVLLSTIEVRVTIAEEAGNHEALEVARALVLAIGDALVPQGEGKATQAWAKVRRETVAVLNRELDRMVYGIEGCHQLE